MRRVWRAVESRSAIEWLALFALGVILGKIAQGLISRYGVILGIVLSLGGVGVGAAIMTLADFGSRDRP